ncbi:MAG TPA: YHS domain-containing protein [Phycisphaerae bacterium]|nr:YHS domain-containing protein [Phycisphaerae bacterium]
MQPSEGFLSRVDSMLKHADEQKQIHQDHVRQRMEAQARQADQFNRIANRLAASVIRPRMEALAGRFDNAKLLDPTEFSGALCTCVFGHVARFPATTRLSVGVSPGDQLSRVSLVYQLQILPVFIQFKPTNQMDFAVDAVDESLAAQWVEDRLAEFVETYLELETAKHYQTENMETDPVCGMPVNRNWAAAKAEHGGKTYYFCIDECRRRFEEQPNRYATEMN